MSTHLNTRTAAVMVTSRQKKSKTGTLFNFGNSFLFFPLILVTVSHFSPKNETCPCNRLQRAYKSEHKASFQGLRRPITCAELSLQWRTGVVCPSAGEGSAPHPLLTPLEGCAVRRVRMNTFHMAAASHHKV